MKSNSPKKRAPAVTMPPPHYVDTPVKLIATVALLGREKLLALDTESNSLHAYQERVCLIQVSTRQHDYIIDPLRLTSEELKPFGALLADPSVEKVFHAAEYDLLCLKRDYGFQVEHLFDTMIAARVCGLKETGLGSLVKQFFGIEMDKTHQRDDWGDRPLSDASLVYAQADTHYLPALRDQLEALLIAGGHIEEAEEWFDEVAHFPPGKPRRHTDGDFWRLALPNQMTQEQAGVLRAVYNLREKLAQRRDVPPFKIVSDQALVAIARAMPSRPMDLRHAGGLAASQIDRYGEELIAAVRQGQAAAPPQPPPLDPPADPLVVERYSALREWRKARAAERGVEADVIVSKDALWSLAERAPLTVEAIGVMRGFGTWRQAQYGAEVIRVLRRFHREQGE
jgi:ribonuclease D